MPRATDEPHFSVETRPQAEGRTTVVVAGEVDVATSGELRSTVVEHLEAGAVLLDLRQVTFMDSSGIAALDRMLRDGAERGWELRLCNGLHERVAQVLELTGMLAVLPFQSCEEP